MLIISWDFHARRPQIAMRDTATGAGTERRLDHESGEAQKFYEGLKEPALVGIERPGYAPWLARMLAELGHELVGGKRGRFGIGKRASRSTTGGTRSIC